MIRGTPGSEHLEQTLSLSPDPYVDLFEVRLNPGLILRLTQHPTLVWNNLTWENYPLELTGISTNTTGESNRPQLKLANLLSALSVAISSGIVYQGSVTRFRVLSQALISGEAGSYLRNFWDINQVTTLTRDYAILELRSPMDRNDYKLPARQFYPPEFPYVRIK